MHKRYAYDHAWAEERIRLGGLEEALDPGTRDHLRRLGVRPGWRCLDVGAGGGTVAIWLAEQVAPDGDVVATDLETGFLERAVAGRAGLSVLKQDIAADDLPAGFDVVHARYLVEWLGDKRGALTRMAGALRPGGVLLVEEPDFVTLFATAEPPALRKTMLAAMRHLESICPVDVEYGRRLVDDMSTVGLVNLQAEGRCPVVRGGSPPAAHFLRLTLQKFRTALLENRAITEAEFACAVAALEDPTVSVYMPMTVAAWGWRPK